MEDCCFEILPDVLLQKVWPAERVLEGMRSCWFLRARLPALMEDVSLSDPQTTDWQNQLFTSLSRFRFKTVSLDYSNLYAIPLTFTAFHRLTIRTKAHKRSLVFEDWVHFHRIQCGLKREREREVSALNPRLLRTIKGAMSQGLSAALVRLDLRNRSMGVRGAALLALVLEDCRELRFLDIGSNFIQTEGMSQLAKANLACTRLAHLDLHKNHILWNDPAGSDLSLFMGKCTQIAHLDLRENDVHWQSDDEDLQRLIGQCGSQLTHLDLSCNSNTSKSAVQSIVARCSALQRLDLHRNRMGNLHSASLMEHIAGCCHLAVLDLSTNDVDARGATGIAHSLAVCTALRRLDLSHNPLGCRGIAALAPALAELPLLSHLRLHNTSAALASATLLTALLLRHHAASPLHSDLRADATGLPPRSLTALDLSANLLSDAEVAQLASLLMQGGPRCQMREVRLGQTETDRQDEGEKEGCSEPSASLCAGLALAAAFTAGRPLRALELVHCGLGDEGVSLLADAVGQWGGWLETLDLRGNGIGDDGAERLAAGLAACSPGVRVVLLAMNRLGRGAGMVLEGCAWSVEEVDLSENEVDCASATALARELRRCRVLERLSLQGNQIADAGCEALKAALDAGPGSLRLVDLQCNLITVEATRERGSAAERERGRRVTLTVTLSEYVAPAWEDDELARTRGKRVKEWQKKRELAGERPQGDGMGGHWFALGTSMGLR